MQLSGEASPKRGDYKLSGKLMQGSSPCPTWKLHSEAKIVGNRGLQRLADAGRAAGGLVTKRKEG